MLTLFDVELLAPAHLDAPSVRARVLQDVHPLGLPDLGYRFAFTDDAGAAREGVVVRKVEPRVTDGTEILPPADNFTPVRLRVVELTLRPV